MVEGVAVEGALDDGLVLDELDVQLVLIGGPLDVQQILGRVDEVRPVRLEQDRAIVKKALVVGPAPNPVVVELVLEGVVVEDARAEGLVLGRVDIELVVGGVAVEVAGEAV